MPGEDKRQEKRIDICSVVLPFLGTRVSDHQPFQYLLQDVSPGGICIALPRWVMSREVLQVDDLIDFHVPFLMGTHVLSIGKITWQRWDKEFDQQVLGASLTRSAPAFYPVYLEVETRGVTLNLTDFRDEGDILAKAVKDAVLLKRGLLIYLGHLEAFFSRVGGLWNACGAARTSAAWTWRNCGRPWSRKSISTSSGSPWVRRRPGSTWTP